MSFDRDDFYNECKDYCKSIEIIKYIDNCWEYDSSNSLIYDIKVRCYQIIEFYEKKYHDRVLKNE